MKFDKQVIISDKADNSFEALLFGIMEGNTAKLNLYTTGFNLLDITDHDFWGCMLKLRSLFRTKKTFYFMPGLCHKCSSFWNGKGHEFGIKSLPM